MKEFYSILNPEECLLEIEKSKFIAYTFPVETEEQATNFINEIKKKHYNATHNVSAFYLRENHGFKKYSDDGEPSGTAGMPSLQAIINKNVIDVCVVITRYFGGIKLGAGGLARAYADATIKGLEKSVIIKYEMMTKFQLSVAYDLLNSVQYFLGKKNVPITDSQYGEQVDLQILLIEEELGFLEELINLTASKIQINELDSIYVARQNDKILSYKEVR